MDTLAPAVADAFNLLREDLYRQLDEAESSALSYQDWEQDDIDTARELIPHAQTALGPALIHRQR